MLDFDGALDAPGSGRFGQGSGMVILDRVDCDGTEENLADCGYSDDARYTCSHTSDAGAVCYSGDHPKPLQVRLISGSNDAEGSVQVLNGDSWGTVCDDSWDLRDARVVCKMLGFAGALGAPRSARFGQGSGPISLDAVGCDGTEENIAECIHRGLGVHYCGHDEDAGAICYKGEHPKPFDVRLSGGSSSAEGRVEVLYNGSWGTVCDNGWDLRDARVVCRMRGFDGALDAPTSARFGQGSGVILLDLVGCEGTEANLADCAHLGIGVNYCGHDEDAGAICYSGNHPDSLRVRLINGSSSSEGRVEVSYNGTWGTICDDGWDLQDAKVVCRMLDLGEASAAPGSARYGEGSDETFLSLVGCEGTEKNLADCGHLGFGVHSCKHNEDASVVCLVGVRLVGGANEYEGRVEIFHEGSWGTVCDDLWDLDDATVVCKQLGFGGASAAIPGARFGQGSGNIFLDGVRCNGTEPTLKDCKHKGLGVHDCGHKEDASARCIVGTNIGPGTYPHSEVSDVTMSITPSAYHEKLSVSGTSAVTVVPVTETISNNLTIPTTTDLPNTRSLMAELPKIFLLGLCALFFSIILVLFFWFCHRRISRRREESDLNADIYTDVPYTGALQANSLSSAYQDLNAPPRLPHRRKGDMIPYNFDSNKEYDGYDKADRNSSQYTTGKELHDYMDMNPVYDTPHDEKDSDPDGYILPTENASDEKAGSKGDEAIPGSRSSRSDYFHMNAVYETTSVGKDEYVDGYTLPCVENYKNDSRENDRGQDNGSAH